ncbi:cytochrome c [uncultured Sulfitobacter sp.]|uniref:c-type cytochrome n=1 Tax=uncultured Sulfitobacter sp. TaxID=191468 RepID=UPI002602EE7C|nr:cytochrome c [uncultured Sulfitobacter sp.]
MKKSFAILLAMLAGQNAAIAQDIEAGASLYEMHCSVCHGLEARGNGPLAPALLLQPPSLRDLVKRHDGFPMERVVTRIDGRDPLVSHGSPMPIYGPFFEGDDTALKMDSGQPILTSRPIADLIAYLKDIQE